MSTLGVSLMERAVTLEDESGRASLTQLHYLENDCTIYNRLQQAMSEIHWHVRRNRDAAIMSGNFYFKLTPELKLVLILATQIKTERPVLVLNSSLRLEIRLFDQLKSSNTAMVMPHTSTTFQRGGQK